MSPQTPRYSTLFFLMAVLYGCTPGKGPFLMVQICLGDERNLSEFTGLMRAIAQSDHMNFVDGSSQTKRDLITMNALRQKGPIIHMGLERKDGLGLIAGNIGLPGYQVAVGFSEGSDSPAARAFANRVVERLKSRWLVETVPDGKGAFPLKGCGNTRAKTH